MMTGLKRDYCEEMFWWPEIAEILLYSGGLKMVQRRILLYWVNYSGPSPPCWSLGCWVAGLQWREWLPKCCSCILSSHSASVQNPSPLHTKSLHCQQHRLTLLMVNHWFSVKCFLLGVCSHNWFLFCLLSICFISYPLVAVQYPSFPLFYLCWEKASNGPFSSVAYEFVNYPVKHPIKQGTLRKGLHLHVRPLIRVWN